MFDWLKRPRAAPVTRQFTDRTPPSAAAVLQRFAVPAEYRPLHKFLNDRYADTIVLTFDDIESLIGAVLPTVAFLQREWWANASDDRVTSPQACAWLHAHRTALPNLSARTVTFIRTSEG